MTTYIPSEARTQERDMKTAEEKAEDKALNKLTIDQLHDLARIAYRMAKKAPTYPDRRAWRTYVEWGHIRRAIVILSDTNAYWRARYKALGF